jgi:predicted phosphodiesterase
VASGAIQHARLHQADRVFCGHTHKAISIEREGIAYYNSGNWADFPPTYLTIDAGGVRIHEYHESPEAHDLANTESTDEFGLPDLDENEVEDNEYEVVPR